MKKNLLLSFATLICGFLGVLIGLSFVLSTGALIYWHINPDFYTHSSWVVSQPLPDGFFNYSVQRSWVIGSETATNPFAFSKIRPFSLYLLYVQCSAIQLVLFGILLEFSKILKSVRRLQSFRTSNVRSFKKIGKYLFAFFILSSFYLISFEQGSLYGFYPRLTPLVLMLVSFVLSEIFKEGNHLYEESQLTV